MASRGVGQFGRGKVVVGEFHSTGKGRMYGGVSGSNCRPRGGGGTKNLLLLITGMGVGKVGEESARGRMSWPDKVNAQCELVFSF